MAGEKFFLNFLSDGFGLVEIDEPISYNTLSFDFQQKDRGYGRDITFNGGEAALEFVTFRNHYLDKLLYYYHYFGYESKVQLSIQFGDVVTVVGDLDFAKATTDDFEYFKCKIVQTNNIQIVKRRESTKVDLFSNKDIDGNNIGEATTQKILLKPKAITKSSQWEQSPFNDVRMAASGGNLSILYHANPCTNIVKSDIDDTLTFFESSSISNNPSSYYIVDAKDKMTNIKVAISGINLNITTDTDNGGKGYVDFHLFVAYGTSNQTGTKIALISSFLDTDQNQSFSFTQTDDFVVTIPALNRGEKIWVYFEYKVSQSSDIPGNPRSECFSTITGMKTTVTAETSTYYSVTEGVRLIDAIRQVVKSISGGLFVDAPIFDEGSDYYNTFLLNGNLLRGITDRPFYLSLEDIQKSITECNADYEVNDFVFFGNERDFYTPIECGFFDTTQFSGFEKKFNERMSINQFNYKYRNFQTQKENEITNTYDTVHGESTLTLFNKNVENKKEVSIEWIRDSFLLEEARSKAIEITTETSYQDDDKIFAVDTVENLSDKTFTETTEFKHEYHSETGYLILRTKSEPNFLTLGIKVDSYFYINKPDKNAGKYKVVSVDANTLELTDFYVPIDHVNQPYPNSNNDGVRFTTYRYTIANEDAPFINYTNENITNIAGINGADSYSNLRYSVKRNIENYYPEYLATCNSYWKDKPLKTTWYKNNRDFTCTYLGLTTKEGEDYLPTEKTLSPFIYENVIFANVELDEFFDLQTAIRTDRGFIRTIDKNNNVIKLFPKKMNYEVMSKELNIIGEEKYEPTQMTISTADNVITINNETTLMTLDYDIKEDKLFVYDSNRQLLYSGVYWDNVSINGGYADSISELDDLMKLL